MAENHSTRQLLEKIPNYPCLYRHKVNATYYGIKKIGSKRKEHSLQTTDRKIAERKLKRWLEDFDKIDSNAERTTFSELLDKFSAANEGKGKKTRATNTSIINVLKKTWAADLQMRVSHIRPSHLNEWLALHEGQLKHTSYNRYAGFLKQLFEIAVGDKMISESPCARG
ncbi:MAG: hypothetical protein JWQ71_1355 [Pedosphaera sp.]|nr:hypothetical protein [Pedosphaera sp.]